MATNHSILHEVEIYLYENYMNPGSGTYIGKVKTERALDLMKVCKSAVLRGGAGVNVNTMFHSTSLVLKEMAYLLCDGFSINFGYFSISLKVKGVFKSANDTFDPERHSLQFQITPGATMRRELPSVRVKTRGVKKDAIYIDAVSETATGLNDGTITPNDDILIQGTRIRIAPDDGSDPEVGIFLIADDGTITPVTRRLAQNSPSCVIARIPALPPGSYTLRMVTKFSSSRNSLLKNAISADYDSPLIVI